VQHYDYTTVGHVTADVLADGSRRAGGGAFYSALQAARLGQRTLIITQGVSSEIEELLAPYRREFSLEIHPAAQTTTLQTVGAARPSKQRVLAWAGPIEHAVTVDTSILHLAPVARETAGRWQGHAEFIGLTPQGLVRTWAGPGAEFSAVPLAPEQLPQRCDAIVISEAERDSCAWLVSAGDGDQRGLARGAASGANATWTRPGETLVAVTAEGEATALHIPGGAPLAVAVPQVERFADDVGAGDVFAAAFFVALREGRSALEAAAFGNAAAAVRIAGAGPGAVGDRDAIQARLGALT
jgi:sugar/nucleoside kinase (ribokinase family)